MIYFITQDLFGQGGSEVVSRKLINMCLEFSPVTIFNIVGTKRKSFPFIKNVNYLSTIKTIDVSNFCEYDPKFGEKISKIKDIMDGYTVTPNDKVFVHVPWDMPYLMWLKDYPCKVYIWVHEGFFLKYSQNNDYPDYYDMRKFLQRNDLFKIKNFYPVFMSEHHALLWNACFCGIYNNAVCIPNPVGITDTEKPEKKALDGRPVKVLIVVNGMTRLINKGIDFAMTVINFAYAKQLNYKFIFASSWEDTCYRDEFIDYYGKFLFDNDYVCVTGLQSQEELAMLYKSCDICLIPSYVEGFSNVAIEAQNYGLPIVISETISTLYDISDINFPDGGVETFKYGDVLSVLKALNNVFCKYNYHGKIKTFDYQETDISWKYLKPIIKGELQYLNPLLLKEHSNYYFFMMADYFTHIMKSVYKYINKNLPEICSENLKEMGEKRRLIQRCDWGLNDGWEDYLPYGDELK